MLRAFSFADDNAGRSKAANIAMMAMTTRSSMRVNPKVFGKPADAGLAAPRTFAFVSPHF
jgi:hypothetical protein